MKVGELMIASDASDGWDGILLGRWCIVDGSHKFFFDTLGNWSVKYDVLYVMMKFTRGSVGNLKHVVNTSVGHHGPDHNRHAYLVLLGYMGDEIHPVNMQSCRSSRNPTTACQFPVNSPLVFTSEGIYPYILQVLSEVSLVYCKHSEVHNRLVPKSIETSETGRMLGSGRDLKKTVLRRPTGRSGKSWYVALGISRKMW